MVLPGWGVAVKSGEVAGVVREPVGGTLLTKVAQIMALSPEAANSNTPVRILGMVTCYDPRLVLFVQDETAGVFVFYNGPPLDVQVGQYLWVSGWARPGIYSPFIDSPKFEAATRGPEVKPRQVSLAQIELGALDAQLIKATGVIRGEEVIEDRLRLDLVDPPHRISVWLPSGQTRQRQPLLGSLVSVRGVVGVGTDGQRHPTGFQIFANRLSDIEVLERGATNIFAGPLESIAELKTYYGRNNRQGLVRVRGIVTGNWQEKILFIQDASGAAEVRSQGALQGLKPGTGVEVAGYVTPELDAPVLEDAAVRNLQTSGTVQPVQASAEALSNGAADRQLVELEAQYLGLTSNSPNCVVIASRAGPRLIRALLPRDRPGDALGNLPVGSRVRLTGICRAEKMLGTQPAINLLLRGPQDVQLIGAAPLGREALQARAFGAAAAALSAGLLAALVLVARQRRAQAGLLRVQKALQAEMGEGEKQLRRSIEERERIARDLHDDIMQSIYAVGLNLEECRRAAKQPGQDCEARLGLAINMLNASIRSIRGFISGLEPKLLNGNELKTALKSVALTSGEGSVQFQIEVDPAGASRLTSTEATQLLHIAKEAISNSLRHARPSLIAVSLQPAGNDARLEIRDDGCGFDPGSARGAGHGLRNMAARAQEIGAELKIVSAIGQGCCISVAVRQHISK